MTTQLQCIWWQMLTSELHLCVGRISRTQSEREIGKDLTKEKKNTFRVARWTSSWLPYIRVCFIISQWIQVYITLTAEQEWMLHCEALAGCLTSSYYLLNEVTHEQIWRYKRAKTPRSLEESSFQNWNAITDVWKHFILYFLKAPENISNLKFSIRATLSNNLHTF